MDRYHVSCVPQDTFEHQRERRRHIYQSSRSMRLRDERTVPRFSHYSVFRIFRIGRKKRNRSADISGDTLKNDPASWMCSLLPASVRGPSRERFEWTGLCIYEKMPIESVTTCACNYSLREKSTKRLRALTRLMGTRVSVVCIIDLLCAHTYNAYLRVRACIRP